MPHPAINDTKYSTESVYTAWKHSNGVNISGMWVPAVRQVTWRREPASVSNPIRKDGTRGLSPYSIDRLYFSQRSSPLETFTTSWGWMVSPASQSAIWAQLFSGSPSIPAVFQKFHPVGFRQKVENLAKITFLNKLADASGKDAWALGVAAGEFREVVGMTSDLARRLVGAVRSISRSINENPKRVANTLRLYGEGGMTAVLKQVGWRDTTIPQTIVEAWLIKQFGIDPLVSDIHNATIALSARFSDPVVGAETFTATIRGGAGDKLEFEVPVVGTSNQNGMIGLEYAAARVVCEAKCSYAAKYQLPVKPTAFQRLGLYNPLLLTAELTRFSWMVDYGLTLTDWLRACMAGQDCRFIEGTKSTLSRTTGNGGYSEPSANYKILTDPMKSPYVLSTDRFERSLIPLTGVLPPMLPGVKNQLGVKQLANSIAALTTLVGGRSQPGPPVIRY